MCGGDGAGPCRARGAAQGSRRLLGPLDPGGDPAPAPGHAGLTHASPRAAVPRGSQQRGTLGQHVLPKM